jgi:sterol desaturase/sphingolipid hydroxylase (fatty acid hydroxylase superfamily)
MQTVRRLYLYVMSGIALAVLLVGLDILLSVIFHAVGIGEADRIAARGPDRQALSVAAALIVVGLLVWGVHWWLVERSLRPDNPRHDEERAAAERALYLTLVLAVLLIFGVLAAVGLLEFATTRLLGFRASSGVGVDPDSGSNLATVLVTGTAWAYHVMIRQRDLRAGPLTGAAAWMPRAYLYGATLLGLVFTSYNMGSLLGAGVTAISGRVVDDFGSSPQRQAAIAIAGTVGWGIVWLGHWWYAAAITRGTGWRAESERVARLRVAYFVAAIGSLALATAIYAFVALNGAIGQALGTNVLGITAGTMDAIVAPVVSLIPWAAAWLLHRTLLFAEARSANDSAQLSTADRLDAAVVALIGLIGLAGGLAGLLHQLVDLASGGLDSDTWRQEFAFYAAAAVIGALLWFWNWRRLQARHRADPSGEADSTVRRAYLLIVVGAAVIVGLGSLAFVLYRLFAEILDVGFGGEGIAEFSVPASVLVVAVVVATYHALVLRGDRALRAMAGVDSAAEAAAGEALPERRVLVLSGPPDADLDAAVAAMRATLSPELTLERSPPED